MFSIVLYGTAPFILIAMVALNIQLLRMKKHSHITKKSITRKLRRIGRVREWRVLEHVTLSDGKESGTVDQVVVGPFGVLLVNDLHRQGGYYGDLGADEWIVSDGGAEKTAKFRERIASPLKECKNAEGVLRRRLMAERLGGVNIHILLAVTQMRVEVYIPGDVEELVLRGELKKALSAERFQKDRGVDVDAVARLIQGQ